jgi:signal transduction histidine kinase
MDKTSPSVPEEQRFILSSLSPSRAQRRLALAVVIALTLASFITLGPLSTLQLGRIDAFVPTYATALCVIDLITAVLLFAQFSIVRSGALAVLASGYLFAALILIPWMLTLPGVFAPGGLLGAGRYSTQWLLNLRHIGFPMFVIAYALFKDAADPTRRRWQGSAAATILSSVTLTTALVCAVTLYATAGHALLPHTLLGSAYFPTIRLFNFGVRTGLCVAALILLWMRLRSVLDLWLMVVICVFVINLLTLNVSLVSPFPLLFTVGWYASLLSMLVSGSVLLIVLLYEITALYGQLLRSIRAQRRERQARLMTGDAVTAAMAHEIRQPLSAMITNADSAVNWLDRSTPDIEQAKAALRRIAANGRRAGEVIGSIRMMFKSDPRKRISLDINELIKDALALLGDDLQKHRVAVETEPSPQLPQVIGDRIQLQLVILNLITNAIDSMAAENTFRALSIRSELQAGGVVMISVADNGKGIASQEIDLIFNPRFTTKSSGMGMGLSICRSIIEAHGGRLWVADNMPRGAVFQFVLPVAA